MRDAQYIWSDWTDHPYEFNLGHSVKPAPRVIITPPLQSRAFHVRLLWCFVTERDGAWPAAFLRHIDAFDAALRSRDGCSNCALTPTLQFDTTDAMAFIVITNTQCLPSGKATAWFAWLQHSLEGVENQRKYDESGPGCTCCNFAQWHLRSLTSFEIYWKYVHNKGCILLLFTIKAAFFCDLDNVWQSFLSWLITTEHLINIFKTRLRQTHAFWILTINESSFWQLCQIPFWKVEEWSDCALPISQE